MIKLPKNCTSLSESMPRNYNSFIGGFGVPIKRVKVSEPGNGFSQRGVWDLVQWEHAHNCKDGWNVDDGIDEPFACSPVFVRD